LSQIGREDLEKIARYFQGIRDILLVAGLSEPKVVRGLVHEILLLSAACTGASYGEVFLYVFVKGPCHFMQICDNVRRIEGARAGTRYTQQQIAKVLKRFEGFGLLGKNEGVWDVVSPGLRRLRDQKKSLISATWNSLPEF
jgi:hypothetical protein